jgi:hypothetical protein
MDANIRRRPSRREVEMAADTRDFSHMRLVVARIRHSGRTAIKRFKPGRK